MILFLLEGGPFSAVLHNKEDYPCGNHNRAERLPSAHLEEVIATEKVVRMTEKFDEESENAIPHKVESHHLVAEKGETA